MVDELNMEPMPENPVFREELHYVEVFLDEDWSAAVPRVICNDPEHKTKNGSTHCRMTDLVNDEGWSAFRIPDSMNNPVIGKFQFGFEKEWEEHPTPGEPGWWEIAAIFQKILPIEGNGS